MRSRVVKERRHSWPLPMGRQKTTLRLILEPVALAIGLALLVRGLLFQIYSIPSPSMNPTLEVGDHIAVTPYGGFLFRAEPRRGDVIVFRLPGMDSYLVKRIIATPGDLVESVDGRVRISGRLVAEPFLADGEKTVNIHPAVIPSDCYYVLGDHRSNSLDSRAWGVVPRSSIVGRARLVLWSSGDGRSSSPAEAAPRDGSSSHPPASLRRVFQIIR
jgi:signal peptidase I